MLTIIKHKMKRKCHIKICLIFFLLMLSYKAGSQIPITLTNAIDSALENNYDIRIAKINTRINTVNNSFGMAGGLPSVNATASENNSAYNLEQKTSSGLDIKKNNVNSNSLNGGVSASMVLFNGFKIIAAKGRLNLLQKQSELQLNQQIQNTISDIMVTYFDIIRQQTYLSIIQSSLDVTSKKMDIVKDRFNVGMANEADLLQTEMDLNTDEQNLKNQQLIIEQGKINLLRLMGVKKYFQISVNDTILVDQSIRKDSIVNFLENNPQYLSSDQQVKINEQIVKELKAQRYPSVRINTGYNFVYNSSSAGFNLFTQNYGPTIGASLLIPIFNGNIYKTQQDVAHYNVVNARLQKESLLLSLMAESIKTYQVYENSLQQMATQKTSYENAGKLVKLVIQRFRLNQATILDVKAAEASFETAGYMFVNLQYAAKTSEIELKRLVFRLGY
jgi:outer membrane protein